MDIDLGVWTFTVTLWSVIGFVGLILFSLRFVIQWMMSERRGQSYIPIAFWYFSIFGGATLLAYAFHQEDPVFILGQGGGLLIYLRNLQMVNRERAAARQG